MSVSSVADPPPPAPPPQYDIEYRAIADDAWYNVRTVLEGEKLRVKYDNFSEEHDNVFKPNHFKSLEEIKAFEKRFRRVSVQLQDKECKSLTIGTVVCASHSFTDLDVRFYDAVVDDAIRRNHSYAENGEEQCMCSFVVIWQHGPMVGCLAAKKIENLCLVQPASLRHVPNVPIFTKIHREKLQNEPPLPTFLPVKLKRQSSFDHLSKKGSKCATQSLSFGNSWTSEDRVFNHAQRIKEEVDIGGIGNQHVVLIDNLDKDLSPSTIAEFIYRLTSLSVRAYVFPCLSSETYTNGAIVLDCEESFQKLCDFLDKPDHIIMSRRGRPWVIAAKLSGHDSYLVSLGNLMPEYQEKLEHETNGIGKDLKVVCSGFEEYKTAKQLRDLFMEFAENLQLLHKTLALEEKKILQPSFVM